MRTIHCYASSAPVVSACSECSDCSDSRDYSAHSCGPVRSVGYYSWREGLSTSKAGARSKDSGGSPDADSGSGGVHCSGPSDCHSYDNGVKRESY